VGSALSAAFKADALKQVALGQQSWKDLLCWQLFSGWFMFVLLVLFCMFCFVFVCLFCLYDMLALPALGTHVQRYKGLTFNASLPNHVF
jgi:hypothetical protein